MDVLHSQAKYMDNVCKVAEEYESLMHWLNYSFYWSKEKKPNHVGNCLSRWYENNFFQTRICEETESWGQESSNCSSVLIRFPFFYIFFCMTSITCNLGLKAWDTLHSCQHLIFLSTFPSPRHNNIDVDSSKVDSVLQHYFGGERDSKIWIMNSFGLESNASPIGIWSRVLMTFGLPGHLKLHLRTQSLRYLFSRCLEETWTVTHQFITHFTLASMPSTFDSIPRLGMVISAWELSCMDAMVRDCDRIKSTTKENKRGSLLFLNSSEKTVKWQKGHHAASLAKSCWDHTEAWLAQLVECQSAVWESRVRVPHRTNI